MSAVSARPNLFVRSWTAYTAALRARPIRTKVATATVLGLAGDTIAQLGIEGRKIRWDTPEQGDSLGEGSTSAKTWNAGRALRLTMWSGLLYAPMAHFYLGWNNRIIMSTKFKTVLVRVVVDALTFAPTVNFMFPLSQGILEGKPLEEIRAKIAMVFLPTWARASMVFTPAAAFNYTFVPLQHRALVMQAVALGWQAYLSYINNIANMRMAQAEAHLHTAATSAHPPTAEEIQREVQVEQNSASAAQQKLRPSDSI